MQRQRAGFWFTLAILTLARLARADAQVESARWALDQAEQEVAVAASVMQQRQQEVHSLVASQQALLSAAEDARRQAQAAQEHAGSLASQLARAQRDVESFSHLIAQQSVELDRATGHRNAASATLDRSRAALRDELRADPEYRRLWERQQHAYRELETRRSVAGSMLPYDWRYRQLEHQLQAAEDELRWWQSQRRVHPDVLAEAQRRRDAAERDLRVYQTTAIEHDPLVATARCAHESASRELQQLVEQHEQRLALRPEIVDASRRLAAHQHQVDQIERDLASALSQRSQAEAALIQLGQRHADAMRSAQIADETAAANQSRADRLAGELWHAQAALQQSSVSLSHALARRDAAAVHYRQAVEWSVRRPPPPGHHADPQRHRRQVTERERQAQRREDERREDDRQARDQLERQAEQRDQRERQDQREQQARQEEENRRREARERESRERESRDRETRERESSDRQSRESDDRRRESSDRGDRYTR